MTTPDHVTVHRVTVHLEDRDIDLKLITDAQFAMLGNLGKKVLDEKAPAADRMKASGTMMTILLSMIISEDDREYVENLIVIGKVDLGKLTAFIHAFKQDDVPKTRVTRARAPKK